MVDEYLINIDVVLSEDVVTDNDVTNVLDRIREALEALDALVEEGLISWYEYNVDEITYNCIVHTTGGDI